MWNKIRSWFHENDVQVAWFIIGNFAAWFVVDIGNQNFFGAAMDAIVVVVNYAFRPVR